MRLAVISDIHADLASLERALVAIDASGVDEVWCLGDIVGLGGRDASEVVNVVRERCALVLGGNHDAWVAGTMALEILPLPRQRLELSWQRAQLNEAQLAWLAARPPHLKRAAVELWHGSAEDPLTGAVNTEAEATEHFNRQRADIGLIGHTHRAMAGHLGQGGVRWGEPPIVRLDLSPDRRWLLNPGAIADAGSWLELDLAASAAVWHRVGRPGRPGEAGST